MKVEIDDFKAVCTLVCSFDSVRNFIDNNSDYFNDKILKNLLNWLFKECKGVRTPAAWMSTGKPMTCWKLLSIDKNQCVTNTNFVTFIKQGIDTIKQF